MTPETKCEITGCNNAATGHVSYAHPDPAMRWEADLCDEHKREAFKAKGRGEYIFSPLGVRVFEDLRK